MSMFTTGKYARALIVLAAFAFMVSSCATTGATHGGSNELTFAIESSEEIRQARFGTLVLFVESVDDPEVRRRLIVNYDDDFVAADALPSGEYRVSRMTFRFAGSALVEELPVPHEVVVVGGAQPALYPYVVVLGRSGVGRYVDMRPISSEEIVTLGRRIAS
ncbi:MAG: hypothetical protein MI724_12515 [Spirochaetales bacterium]|nr:hypothetical protein [Spirochaetales bacterium]